MASWPNTLPPPLLSSLSATFGSNSISRATQAGRQEVLRFGSAAPDHWKASFRLIGGQIGIFESFFRNDLNFGTNWFSAPWISSKMGYPDHKTRILGYPSESVSGVRYKDITVELLVKKSSACPSSDDVWPPILLV